MRSAIVFLIMWFPCVIFSQTQAQFSLLSTGTSETWKTVEIGILFPDEEAGYRQFISTRTTGVNPYTVNNVWMLFTCNGAKYYRPAFYYEDAIPDLRLNRFITEASEWPWRVRFSPPKEGIYECILLIGENPATAVPKSTGISFEVKKGLRHGILNIVPGDPHLAFTDGTPFFILGQNIAWSDSLLLGRGYAPELPPVYHSGYYQMFHFMHNLADNGGNYLRICLAPWSFAIDNKGINFYEQNKAVVIDSIMELAEERGLYVQFVILLTNSYFTNTPKADWHPVRLAYQKPGMVAADLLTDSSALAAYDQYLRYIHARWIYSANVAVLEVLPEVYNWEGYSKNQQKFMGYLDHVRDELRTVLYDSVRIVHASFERHFRDACKSPAIQFVDMHYYDSRFETNENRYKECRNDMKKFGKPFLFGEMGIVHGAVNACDPDDWDYCNDVSYHNSLWSTAFMGGMGAGMYWWQWQNDGYREANYKPLRWFIDSVASGMTDYNEADMWEGNGLENYYCRSDYKVVGWVHNTSYWWGNITGHCADRAGRKMLMPKDDDAADTLENRIGNTFVVEGMRSRQTYLITYYDTRSKNVRIGSEVVKSSNFGRLRLKMPALTDCAYRVDRYFPPNF